MRNPACAGFLFQVIARRQLHSKVFEDVKHRRGFRGRQSIRIKKERSAKDQHIRLLTYLIRLHAR